VAPTGNITVRRSQVNEVCQMSGMSERNLILRCFNVEVFRFGLSDNLPLGLGLVPTATVTLASFSMVYYRHDYYLEKNGFAFKWQPIVRLLFSFSLKARQEVLK